MRWRSGETAADGVGVETSMILLLSVTEADCLDHQHRRVKGATNHHQRGRSAYRASGLAHRCRAVCQFVRRKQLRRLHPMSLATRRATIPMVRCADHLDGAVSCPPFFVFQGPMDSIET
jgi:hypothetical protein